MSAGASVDVSTCEQLSTSWVPSLRAQRRSPQTIKICSDGLRCYLAWCTTTGLEPLRRSILIVWTAQLLDDGAAAATAHLGEI